MDRRGQCLCPTCHQPLAATAPPHEANCPSGGRRTEQPSAPRRTIVSCAPRFALACLPRPNPALGRGGNHAQFGCVSAKESPIRVDRLGLLYTLDSHIGQQYERAFLTASASLLSSCLICH